MRRYKKPFTDEAKILQAINDFLPATCHVSFSFRYPEEGGSGSYFRIGRMNVPKVIWDKVLADNSITMAEHYRSSTRGIKTVYFGFCYIKSRFGETKVDRYLQGGVKYCDNAEARDFFNGQHQKSVEAICAQIDGGDIEAAKAEKKRLKAAGEYI